MEPRKGLPIQRQDLPTGPATDGHEPPPITLLFFPFEGHVTYGEIRAALREHCLEPLQADAIERLGDSEPGTILRQVNEDRSLLAAGETVATLLRPALDGAWQATPYKGHEETFFYAPAWVFVCTAGSR